MFYNFLYLTEIVRINLNQINVFVKFSPKMIRDKRYLPVFVPRSHKYLMSNVQVGFHIPICCVKSRRYLFHPEYLVCLRWFCVIFQAFKELIKVVVPSRKPQHHQNNNLLEISLKMPICRL